MSEEESRREQLLAVRDENKRTADRVEQGTAYHEPVTLWFTDRQEHVVDVYALSDKQLRGAIKKVGIDPSSIGKPDKLLESLDFVAVIAEAATRDEQITEKLLVNEGAKIALKAFELMNPPKN